MPDGVLIEFHPSKFGVHKQRRRIFEINVVFARVLRFFISGGRKADLVCNRLKIQLRCGIMIL